MNTGAAISGPTAPKRVVGRPFPKGQSGNPQGRPPVARHFRERAREWMDEPGGGWDTLLRIAGDTKNPHHFRALELIAAYAYGRPSQRLEHADLEGPSISFTLNIGDGVVGGEVIDDRSYLPQLPSGTGIRLP